jgi:hypothetical protein
LRFDSYDELLVEVRGLAATETTELGNWSLGEVCRHLANAMDKSIDGGVGFRVPLKIRFLARVFRGRILAGGLRSGFQLPPEAAPLLPVPTSTPAGVDALERAVCRLQETSVRQAHPVFGKMNVSQWNQFHLRHAEMHLSFIVPKPPAVSSPSG